jgi:GalNAc-alpha-(1->4)-GalNAc-alpha-(1->3)-diNAcBac-PP-undecaprenol alpha-1,4-N-acetyl-D-galactosaminyltransferase
MMNILLVIDNLLAGGAQRQIVNLACGLNNRGYSVTLFCYSFGDSLAEPLEKAGIEIIWKIKTSRFSFAPVLNLRKEIREKKIDTLVSFLTTPNMYSILAVRTLIHQPKLIISERLDNDKASATKIERLQRVFYGLANFVVVNSHHLRLAYASDRPLIRKKIVTIYNGYDLDVFKPAKYEPDNHPLRILVISNVSARKNGLCLVRALDILKKDYLFTPYVSWVGNQSLEPEDLDYRQTMDKEIQAYSLQEQWDWLGQRRDIVSLLQTHDVLVHPSFREGLPNAICEALACGRPVIASDTLDHPRLVQDGMTGLLFDWRNPNDLARKIITFAHFPIEARSQMGQNARMFAEYQLSMSRYVNEYETLLNKS